MVPAPGAPPIKVDTRLPRPCPTSSRLELCRVPVSASSTRQVLRVSIDSSTDSVSAGTRIRSQCGSEAEDRLDHGPVSVAMNPPASADSLPITMLLFSSESSCGQPVNASSQYIAMPAIKPWITPGMRCEMRGASSIAAAVAPPISNPGSCHSEGLIKPCHQPMPLGSASHLGNWLRMMMRPTPLR